MDPAISEADVISLDTAIRLLGSFQLRHPSSIFAYHHFRTPSKAIGDNDASHHLGHRYEK